MYRYIFFARSKMLCAWHAFWNVDFERSRRLCITRLRSQKEYPRRSVRIAARIELAAFQKINRLCECRVRASGEDASCCDSKDRAAV